MHGHWEQAPASMAARDMLSQKCTWPSGRGCFVLAYPFPDQPLALTVKKSAAAGAASPAAAS